MTEGLSEERLAEIRAKQVAYCRRLKARESVARVLGATLVLTESDLAMQEVGDLLAEVERLQVKCNRQAVLLAWERDDVDTPTAAEYLGCEPDIIAVDGKARLVATEGLALVGGKR